jgi:hypothetical protein
VSEPEIVIPRGLSSNSTGPTAERLSADDVATGLRRAFLRQQAVERADHERQQRELSGEPIRCYLLSHLKDGLFLAFGTCAVDAARTLNVKLGLDQADTERWSVSGSWSAEDGLVIDVSRWWPHFTAHPPECHKGERKDVG